MFTDDLFVGGKMPSISSLHDTSSAITIGNKHYHCILPLSLCLLLPLPLLLHQWSHQCYDHHYYLIPISPLSPPYLLPISSLSPPYLPPISSLSPPYLLPISPLSPPYLLPISPYLPPYRY